MLFDKYHFLDAFVVQGSNMYLMEHIEHDEHLVGRFCKYRGSNGTLVMDKTKKVLITDSRYEVQDSAKTYGVDSVIITGSVFRRTVDALVHLIDEYKTVGIYGDNFSYSFLELFVDTLRHKGHDVKLATEESHIDKDFAGKTIFIVTDESTDQKLIESSLKGFKGSVNQLPTRLTGVNHKTKLTSLVSQIVVPNMRDCDKFIYIVNKCEFVSWLLNLRGRGSSISQICRGIVVLYIEKTNIKSDTEFDVDAHTYLLASEGQFGDDTLTTLPIHEGEFVTCLKSHPFYHKGEAGDDLRSIKCRLTLDVLDTGMLSSLIGGVSEALIPTITGIIPNTQKKPCIILDESNTNITLIVSLLGGRPMELEKSFKVIKSIPIYEWICDKHPFEIESIRKGLIKESTAFTTFIHKAKEEMDFPKKDPLSVERQLEDALYEEQLRQGAIMKSFNTIAGINQHSAVIHYEAHGEANESIPADGLYEKQECNVILVDAGAQYENALTDTTRTFVKLGKVQGKDYDGLAKPVYDIIPLDLKLAYTAVLKGHIAMANAIMTQNTSLYHLDSLVRLAMASARGGPFTFGHSTGHGVGCGLDVHEGDYRANWIHGISTEKILKPGYLITDEPGCYFLGKWGIRLENILLCKESETHPGCVEFEPLTFIPFERSLILIDELNSVELRWLRDYNRKVVNVLSSRLDHASLSWLLREVDY